MWLVLILQVLISLQQGTLWPCLCICLLSLSLCVLSALAAQVFVAPRSYFPTTSNCSQSTPTLPCPLSMDPSVSTFGSLTTSASLTVRFLDGAYDQSSCNATFYVSSALSLQRFSTSASANTGVLFECSETPAFIIIPSSSPSSDPAVSIEVIGLRFANFPHTSDVYSSVLRVDSLSSSLSTLLVSVVNCEFCNNSRSLSINAPLTLTHAKLTNTSFIKNLNTDQPSPPLEPGQDFGYALRTGGVFFAGAPNSSLHVMSSLFDSNMILYGSPTILLHPQLFYLQLIVENCVFVRNTAVIKGSTLHILSFLSSVIINGTALPGPAFSSASASDPRLDLAGPPTVPSSCWLGYNSQPDLNLDPVVELPYRSATITLLNNLFFLISDCYFRENTNRAISYFLFDSGPNTCLPGNPSVIRRSVFANHNQTSSDVQILRMLHAIPCSSSSNVSCALVRFAGLVHQLRFVLQQHPTGCRRLNLLE